MTKAVLELCQEAVVLGARQFVYCTPEVLGLDDVVRAFEHHILKLNHICLILRVPFVEGFLYGQVTPQLKPGSRFIAGTDVAVKEQREHVVAEIVRSH